VHNTQKVHFISIITSSKQNNDFTIWGKTQVPGREKFSPRKLTLGENLPGKNSAPKLKNVGKNSVPFGVWKGLKEIRREAPKNFLAYIFRR
jgi:hypothetical protein